MPDPTGNRPREPRSDTGSVRAVVVDDEPAAREAIVTLLADESAVEVVGEAGNGTDAVDVVRRLQPDLLFLDIQMPDRDGFAVLEKLGDAVPRGVVFVTAYDEHAIRAFEVHALDYVLKPFGRPRLRAAVDRALERLAALDALTLQRTLVRMADTRRADGETAGELAVDAPDEGRSPEYPRRIGVRAGTRTTVVDVDAIDWLEASGDYVRVHVGETSHLLSERMHALEEILDPRQFLRIHRSLIVNLERVAELHRDADGGGTVVLHDGVRLRVARSRWDALVDGLGVRRI